MLALILGANVYVLIRLWHLLPQHTGVRMGFLAAATVVSACMLLVLPFAERLPVGVSTVMFRIGFHWFFIMVYLALVFLVLDIGRLIPGLHMRALLHENVRTLLVLTVGMTLLMSWGHFRYRQKKRTEVEITLDKPLPAPMKIVMVSDLHLGYNVGKREVARWVELLNRESADLILVAGDLIDNSPRPVIAQESWKPLRDLKSRYGSYAVLGNHEYISGAAESERILQRAGIHPLRDTAIQLENGVWIVGRDDRSNGQRKPLPVLTEPLDKSGPLILLDHQPADLSEAQKAGIDLQLSGHTHYGQIWPFSLVTKLIFEQAYGYLQKGDTHYYVSSGLGIWGGKFRIGTRSEYVVITISSAVGHDRN